MSEYNKLFNEVHQRMIKCSNFYGDTKTLHKYCRHIYDNQQNKLNSAIEVIEFYGSKENWFGTNPQITPNDWYDLPEEKKNDIYQWYGGKKARQWLKENKGE
jgi:hypothetical protein